MPDQDGLPIRSPVKTTKMCFEATTQLRRRMIVMKNRTDWSFQQIIRMALVEFLGKHGIPLTCNEHMKNLDKEKGKGTKVTNPSQRERRKTGALNKFKERNGGIGIS